MTGETTEYSTISYNQMITVYNLKPFTLYLVKVAAYTVAIGPYSPALEIQTKQDGKLSMTFVYCLCCMPVMLKTIYYKPYQVRHLIFEQVGRNLSF